jgi:hypothetical protein
LTDTNETVSNVFYELHSTEWSWSEHKYIAFYNVYGNTYIECTIGLRFFKSNRIWRETTNGVTYIKNKEGSITDPVDMKEFLFIKLKSHAL